MMERLAPAAFADAYGRPLDFLGLKLKQLFPVKFIFEKGKAVLYSQQL